MSTLSIIIPCYNEAENILNFFNATEVIHSKLPLDFEYIFIDDGSTDQTFSILKNLQQIYPECVYYLSFSRNFGKESAIFAGLKTATGEYVTLLDADLQDPPELLLEMWEKIQNPDIDCVAARRIDRKGEPKLISFSSRFFYKIMNHISSTPVIDGVRDFRLMTRQIVNEILNLSEINRFSKGLFTFVGFHTEYVSYTNHERTAGISKFSFIGRLHYAVDGIINFSELPLDLASYFGLFVVVLDLLALPILAVRQVIFHNSVPGWTSMIIVMLFCFGCTLLALGIIGKYLSKIFLETKRRPLYIVRTASNLPAEITANEGDFTKKGQQL